MKKIVVFVEGKEITLEGKQLLVLTSANAGVPTSLIIRDGDVKIAEFATWTYWKEIKTGA